MVGYLPDTVGFYDHMTAVDNLRYTAALIGIRGGGARQADHVARSTASASPTSANKRVGDLLARHAAAAGPCRNPDEGCRRSPSSTSRPPASIRRRPSELLEMIRSLKRDGVAVLLSSHLLERVQSVCDRVALFHAGNIVLLGTVPELARQVLGGGYNVEVEADGEGLAEKFSEMPGVQGGRSVRPEPLPAAGRARRPRRGRRRRGQRRRPAAAACRSRSRRSTPSTTAISRTRQNQGATRDRKMRREGSPWRGLNVVFFRELFDHLTSARMLVLELLVVLFGGGGGLFRRRADPQHHRRGPVPVPAAVRAAGADRCCRSCWCSASWCR